MKVESIRIDGKGKVKVEKGLDIGMYLVEIEGGDRCSKLMVEKCSKQL